MAQETLSVFPIRAPCGACRYLRRKCGDGCIFASYFNSDTDGADKFAVVHKVFGASNVKNLLSDIPVNYRNIAMETLSYEAEARLSNPIYGCVSTIKALQQQVATLQAELTMLQSQSVNTEFSTYATTIMQQHQQQQQPNFNVEVQPTYSNNSHAFTINPMNMSNFNHGFDQWSLLNTLGSHNTTGVTIEKGERKSSIPQDFSYIALHTSMSFFHFVCFVICIIFLLNCCKLVAN